MKHLIISIFCSLLFHQGLLAQINLNYAGKNSIKIHLGHYEGFIYTIDTFLIEPNISSIQVDLPDKKGVYFISTLDRKDKFYFIYAGNSLNILVNENLNQSQVLNNSINQRFKDLCRKFDIVSASIDSVYQLQTASAVKSDMENYNFFTTVAKDMSKNLGITITKAISEKPSDTLSQALYLKYLTHFYDTNNLNVFEILESNDNIFWFSPGLMKDCIALQNTQVGKPMPDVEMVNTKNELINFSKAKSKKSLIVFSASWCMPCKQLIKELTNPDNEQKLFKEADLYLIQSEDNQEGINKAFNGIKTLSANWQNVIIKSEENELAGKLVIGGIPFIIITDGNGVMQSLHRGFDEKTVGILLESIVQD